MAVLVQKSLDGKNLAQLLQSLTISIVLGVIAAVAVRKGYEFWTYREDADGGYMTELQYLTGVKYK